MIDAALSRMLVADLIEGKIPDFVEGAKSFFYPGVTVPIQHAKQPYPWGCGRFARWAVTHKTEYLADEMDMDWERLNMLTTALGYWENTVYHDALRRLMAPEDWLDYRERYPFTHALNLVIESYNHEGIYHEVAAVLNPGLPDDPGIFAIVSDSGQDGFIKLGIGEFVASVYAQPIYVFCMQKIPAIPPPPLPIWDYGAPHLSAYDWETYRRKVDAR